MNFQLPTLQDQSWIEKVPYEAVNFLTKQKNNNRCQPPLLKQNMLLYSDSLDEEPTSRLLLMPKIAPRTNLRFSNEAYPSRESDPFDKTHVKQKKTKVTQDRRFDDARKTSGRIRVLKNPSSTKKSHQRRPHPAIDSDPTCSGDLRDRKSDDTSVGIMCKTVTGFTVSNVIRHLWVTLLHTQIEVNWIY
ncbi:hypothetical protein OSB04_024317 [Centaurea solstitialis]|uniref:Uncharacterized protein n=1 Tax=Centaurea solstitialis TaxID=347529 RepID=A0AA38WA83_9ASTR|nr:hypothetical protein OSB04_024317 [Centaurea solstitialis]